MWKSDIFSDIIALLQAKKLGEAVRQTENYLLAHPGHALTETVRLYASHYRLMVEYWQSGYDDAKREGLYDDLLHRFYMLTANMWLRECNSRSAYRMTVRRMALQQVHDASPQAADQMLESFVGDVALLSLEQDHIRQAKSSELYMHHQQLMSCLFNLIWTSELWHTADADAYKQILLKPTIDVIDQQLLVSAITLAVLNVFDIHKLETLAEVYRLSADERVRQRALVGWVLACDANMKQLYPQMQTMVSELCQDEKCRRELAELQMQLVYCMEAETDTQRIRKEIMPDLLNHSNLRITRNGIEEVDEDSLEDILNPNAAEQQMEKMEESMKKMANMQQQGADIYFGGFSQMKRFTFFDDLSNWLVPFYSQHPGISRTWNNAKGNKFLHMITRIGAFCDSDKYSFVLAFEQVVEKLPKSMLAMVEQGEAVPMPVGGEISMDEQRQPAFIRRVYLQNLYRFFKLHPMRNEFRNPFDVTHADYLFFNNPMMADTQLQQSFVQIASFLLKRNMFHDAVKLLSEVKGEAKNDYQYYMMAGEVARHHGEMPLKPSECFRKALELKPDSDRARLRLARALFEEKSYEESVHEYEVLLLKNEGSLSYNIAKAVCLLHLKRYDEALKTLYWMDYEHGDDFQVKRTLAWALVLNGKSEQAEKIFSQLLNDARVQPADIVNYGYCLWFGHRNREALDMFRRLKGNKEFDPEKEFCQTEAELLREHGITMVEVRLMLDELGS